MNLDASDTLVLLDWDMDKPESKDQTQWPPSNALLSDLLIYKILFGHS